MANEATLSFIDDNRTEDTRSLALKNHPADVDMPYALEQIAGWQVARKKLPAWAATKGIVYPPHLSMEQCSSELTAIYKERLATRLAKDKQTGTFVDLTGGFGVDFSYMARGFHRSVYVERQQNLCQIASHNMPLLGLKNVDVRCEDSVSCLKALSHVSMIFLDPARRDANGGRTFAISDCTPDVVALKDILLDKADNIIVKLSPMLDWHKAVADLGNVLEVHIVSVKNECKELLLVLSKDACISSVLYCVDCMAEPDGTPRFRTVELNLGEDSTEDRLPFRSPSVGMYVYEPNSSVMKSGCFNYISFKYEMSMISENSHLFLSDRLDTTFPGRCFKIKDVVGMNKKEVRKSLDGIHKANVAVRNFPISVADLRKRLKLKDGGDTYIFATTLDDGTHALLMTERIVRK